MRHFDQVKEDDLLVRTNGVGFSSSYAWPKRYEQHWHQIAYVPRG